MIEERCEFCKGAGRDPSLDARLLVTNSWFSTYEDLAPIVASHRLIIPHAHITAFGTLSAREMGEIIDHIHTHSPLASPESASVVFEHGILHCESSGCGISHAHWHMAELLKTELRSFVATVESALKTHRLVRPVELAQGHHSYLFIWDTSQAVGLLFDGRTSPSQFLRKSLAHAVGTSQWDWRVHAASAGTR